MREGRVRGGTHRVQPTRHIRPREDLLRDLLGNGSHGVIERTPHRVIFMTGDLFELMPEINVPCRKMLDEPRGKRGGH